MIDVRVITYPCLTCALSGCILIIPGDIDANFKGVKTGDQSNHVRAHTRYLRTLYLAHSVPEYSNKPVNIILNLLKVFKTS